MRGSLIPTAVLTFVLALAPATFAGAQQNKAGLADRTGQFMVINHEEQYVGWPSKWYLPKGWKSVGITCKYEACLLHVHRLWTDKRPPSIRGHVEEMLSKGGKPR
jgi:MbtH protein